MSQVTPRVIATYTHAAAINALAFSPTANAWPPPAPTKPCKSAPSPTGRW